MAETIISEDSEKRIIHATSDNKAPGEAGYWESTRTEWKPGSPEGNRQTIHDAARAALATNRTYVALATPTTADTVTQVKALSRQNNGLIRLLLGLLEGTT